MEEKFGMSVTTPKFVIEYGAEFVCWTKVIKGFEIAVIEAGLIVMDTEEYNKFLREQQEAALILDMD